MTQRFAGRRALEISYPEALARKYLWHEFGDVHLLLTEATP